MVVVEIAMWDRGVKRRAGEIGKPIILFRHSLDDPALSWRSSLRTVKRAQDLGRVAGRLRSEERVKKDESRLYDSIFSARGAPHLDIIS